MLFELRLSSSSVECNSNEIFPIELESSLASYVMQFCTFLDPCKTRFFNLIN